MSLKARLAREIALTGPMTVADYVVRCLHDPQDGYYATRPALGEGGDFITAPLISQMFGELLGLWVVETWMRLGAPERFRLVEVGPGDGTLMEDALRAMAGAARLAPGLLEACDLILIEPSAPLRAMQAKRLANADPAPRWVASLDRIETDAPVILIANEVLDCMPARQFVRTDGGWAERRVGVTEDGYLIEPAITIPQDATDISISKSGQVQAIRPGQTQPEIVGNIELATFVNEAGLDAIGDNLLKESAASGAPTTGTPGVDGAGVLNQGYTEASNVDAVSEITALIVAQRAYEMNSKVITSADEMLRTASNIRS